jgi:hypothetical protein
MTTQSHQHVLKLKSLAGSNTDDNDTTTSSISDDDDSDHSTSIVDLIRENEQKIRHLSGSYMNRFLVGNQPLQILASSTQMSAISCLSNTIGSTRPNAFNTNHESKEASPSFNLFIETLKELIVREERKRGRSYSLS